MSVARAKKIIGLTIKQKEIILVAAIEKKR
jgi:hypothetical protein